MSDALAMTEEQATKQERKTTEQHHCQALVSGWQWSWYYGEGALG